MLDGMDCRKERMYECGGGLSNLQFCHGTGGIDLFFAMVNCQGICNVQNVGTGSSEFIVVVRDGWTFYQLPLDHWGGTLLNFTWGYRVIPLHASFNMIF